MQFFLSESIPALTHNKAIPATNNRSDETHTVYRHTLKIPHILSLTLKNTGFTVEWRGQVYNDNL